MILLKGCIVKKEGIAVQGRLSLDFQKERIKIGVGDIGNYDSQGHGPPQTQASGIGIRGKIIFGNNRFDLLSFFIGDGYRTIEITGNRCHGYIAFLGYLFDGYILFHSITLKKIVYQQGRILAKPFCSLIGKSVVRRT